MKTLPLGRAITRRSIPGRSTLERYHRGARHGTFRAVRHVPLLQGCRMRTTSLLLLTLLAGVAPLAAQSTGPGVIVSTRTPWLSTDPRYTARIPLRTTQLKAVGVADSTISRLFDIFRVNDLTPRQVDRVLVTERDDARVHGPTDNFGTFVQSQLAAGKRGQALAAAIHAEHRRHGHKHDAEHARKAKLKADREAARTLAHERAQSRRDRPDRPMVNPGPGHRQ